MSNRKPQGKLAAVLLATAVFAACAPLPPPASPASPLVFEPYLVALSVPDLDESVAWYQKNLDFQVIEQMDFPDYKLRITILERDGFRLELVDHEESVSILRFLPDLDNPAKLQGIGKIAFRVDDVDALAARLRGNGVRFQIDVREVPKDRGKTFIILDNSGNWVQFFERG